MIRIVAEGNDNVTQIVHVTVVVEIWAENTRLQHVSEYVDSGKLVQSNGATLGGASPLRLNRLDYSVSVAFEIRQVDPQLVGLAVQVRQDETRWTRWPRASCYHLIELRKIGFRDGLAKICESTHSWKIVAKALDVVPEENSFFFLI